MNKVVIAAFINAFVTVLIHTLVMLDANQRRLELLKSGISLSEHPIWRSVGNTRIYELPNPYPHPIHVWAFAIYVIRIAILLCLYTCGVRVRRFRALILVNILIAGFGTIISRDGYSIFEQCMVTDSAIQAYLFIYNVAWEIV